MKPHRLRLPLLLLLITCLYLPALAQSGLPFKLQTARLLYNSKDPAHSYVQLLFDAAIPDSLIENATGSCATDSLASGATLKTTSIKITLIDAGGGRRVLPGSYTVTLTDCYTGNIPIGSIAAAEAPTRAEKEVEVELTFQYEGTAQALKQTGAAISDIGTAREVVEALINAYNTKAPAKTSDQKNIFAGLSVTVPSGGGNTEGNADLSFHKEFGAFDFLSGKLFDQLVAGGTLKKGSEQNADPRHFSLALTVRKDVLLAGRGTFQKIRQAIQAGNASTAGNLIESLPKRPFSALLLDTGLQFEGDVKGTTIGGISNFVFVAEPRLVSPVFGVPGTKSEAKFTIMPAAIEIGTNLQNPDNPALDGTSIGRFKSGATLNILLDSTDNSVGSHFELDLQVVNRYLWQKETAYDPTTKLVTGTVEGNRYYAQAGLKYFIAKTPFGRPGFRVSFSRGWLPPVYTFNKVFNFGFIFESADEKQVVEF